MGGREVQLHPTAEARDELLYVTSLVGRQVVEHEVQGLVGRQLRQEPVQELQQVFAAMLFETASVDSAGVHLETAK